MIQPYGVILAGGTGRRFGGTDKALLRLGRGRLVDHVAERLAPQVAALAINANGDPARFAGLGLPVVADGVPDLPGPLAGLLAGMDWAAANGAATVVSAPVDTPFLPPDLVPRLILAAEASASGAAVVAESGAEGPRMHPTLGLWPVELRGPLRRALAAGRRRLMDWVGEAGAAHAPFPADGSFMNINSAEDLALAEQKLAPGAG
jgi:molybdenum cofactor guanylyltransferase